MDPQDRAKIIIELDELVETAIKDTVNNRDFDGLNLLDYVDNQTYDYDALRATIPRDDGLLVFGPYDLENLVGAGRSDLNLVIEPLLNEADETVKGFRVSLQDQNTVASSGLATRQDIDNIFILELGEFSTVEEMENLFTQTSDIDGTTAKVSLVGDKLDEIFPNSEADIELVLSNEKPLISETIRQRVNKEFMPDYIAQAMDNLDSETAAQYSELAGDVDIPDTPEGAADAVNVTDEAENIFDDTLERLRNANDEFVNQQLDDVMAQKINEILPFVNTDLSKAEAVGIGVPPGGPQITTSKDPVLNAFADELGKYAMGGELNLSAKRKLWGFMWSAATNDEYGLINEKKSFLPELQDGVDASKLDNSGYKVWKNLQHSGTFRPQSLIGMTANEFDVFGPPPYVRLLDGLDKENFEKTGEYLFQSNAVSEADVVIPEGVDTPETALADDVKEVTNKWTFENFAEKQRTADSVIFRELEDGTVELLVIKRKRGPHRSLYALPGGIVEDEVLNEEKILKAIVDPGKPLFNEFSFHKTVVPFGNKDVIIPDKFSANEIFAAEALREATEEVGLTTDNIFNSAVLPVKYERFDWDARAAKGVDVGGVVIFVDRDWVPKASDDAKSYEWIKIEDVADGKVELAFGHAEFVEDGLDKFIKNNVFQFNQLPDIVKGKSKYTLDIIEKLKNIKVQNSKRNADIIKAANVVREKEGQPLINTKNISFVDKENTAMIDSIRNMGTRGISHSYRSGSAKFNARMRMDPDTIFIDILDTAMYKVPEGITIRDGDIVGEFLVGEDYQTNVKLKPEGKKRIIQEIKDQTLKHYGSVLNGMINDGMQITPVINAMYENARSIINSEDLDYLLNKVFNVLDLQRDGSIGYKIRDVGEFGSELRNYSRLVSENTIISNEGIKQAVSDNINYVKNNYPEAGEALQNIRDRNNKFYAETFPEEIYMDPTRWWQQSGKSFPEAALDIKKLQRGPNNTLIGMTYHGNPGLNKTGREVINILKKELPKFVVKDETKRTVTNFNNAVKQYWNKIATENNLDWLDPKKNRGGNLRGSVMYTTNNPGLAASYALGGNAGDIVTPRNNDMIDHINRLVNNYDVIAKDDVKTINRINSRLNQYGLEFKLQSTPFEDGITLQLKSLDGKTPQLISPIIMQNNFKVPIDRMLHTDMPITRQINNPNVRKALIAALKNSTPDVIYNNPAIFDNVLNVLIEEARNIVYYDWSGVNGINFANQQEEQDRVVKLLIEARDNPDSKIRNYIKEYLIENGQSQTIVKEAKIKNILETGSGSWNDVAVTLINEARFGEQINSNRLQEVLDYYSLSQGDPDFNRYKNTLTNGNVTAGEVLFDLELTKFTKDKTTLSFYEILDFIKQTDVGILGGAYGATNDLMYIKKTIDYLDQNPDLKNKYIRTVKDYLGSSYDTFGIKQKVVDSAGNVSYIINPREHTLRLIAKAMNETTTTYNLKVDPKSGLRGLIDEFRPIENGNVIYKFRKEVDEAVLQHAGGPTSPDNSLTMFLHQATGGGIERGVMLGNTKEDIGDYLQLKSLSEGNIEVTMGTGGGKVGFNFHDNMYIVDPGNKFGVKEPKLSKFITNAKEFTIDQLKIIEDIVLSRRTYADLDDREIKAIAEFIPLEQVMNNTMVSDTQKERWVQIYSALNIDDNRFRTVAGIQPLPMDGIFLNLNEELQEMIAYQALHGDIKAPIIQNHITQLYGEVAAQVDPQDVIPVMKSTGILKMLGNGLDLYDAAVFAPIILDVIMSRTTGVGSTTETIGGSIAEVAMNVYDPSKEDTAFEATWGSPEDPRTLAGGIGNSIDVVKDPIVEVAKENPLLSGFFNSIKEGAISALTTVKNGLGLNEWIYNVKRDMYVSSALKEMGYDGKGNQIPKGLVQKLEGEYESYLPNNEDKYGRPLDVGDNSNMPDYTKGVFRR